VRPSIDILDALLRAPTPLLLPDPSSSPAKHRVLTGVDDEAATPAASTATISTSSASAPDPPPSTARQRYSSWRCVGNLNENETVGSSNHRPQLAGRRVFSGIQRTCLFRHTCYHSGEWYFYSAPGSARPVVFDHRSGLQPTFPRGKNRNVYSADGPFSSAGFVPMGPLLDFDVKKVGLWASVLGVDEAPPHFSPLTVSGPVPSAATATHLPGLTALSEAGPALLGHDNPGHFVYEMAWPILVGMAQLGVYTSTVRILLRSARCVQDSACAKFADAFMRPLIGTDAATNQLELLAALARRHNADGADGRHLCFDRLLVGGSFGLFASGSHTAGKEPLLALYRARVLSWHGLHYAATPAAHRILLVDKPSGRRRILGMREVEHAVISAFPTVLASTTTFRNMSIAEQLRLLQQTTLAISPAGGISTILPLGLPPGAYAILVNYYADRTTHFQGECINCSWTMEAELWRICRHVTPLFYQIRQPDDFPRRMLPGSEASRRPFRGKWFQPGAHADVLLDPTRLIELMKAAFNGMAWPQA